MNAIDNKDVFDYLVIDSTKGKMKGTAYFGIFQPTNKKWGLFVFKCGCL